jgi:predicted ATP-grasp superfamily ATP-dependent carboligase
MIGEKVPATLRGIGSVLAEAFNLRWLWNLDFVLRDEKVFPVEVNPRYSASVEVIEMGAGISSFQEQCYPSLTDRFPSIGKGIYYARNDLRFPDSGPWEHDLTGEFDPWKLPAFADIPERGTAIPAGTPVCTLLVSGSSSGDCREQLQSRARELDQLLDEGLR